MALTKGRKLLLAIFIAGFMISVAAADLKISGTAIAAAAIAAVVLLWSCREVFARRPTNKLQRIKRRPF